MVDSAPQSENLREKFSLLRLEDASIFLQRYRIESFLGKDSYGEVYLVTHLKYGEKRVLKIFYKELLQTEKAKEDFRKEFDIAKRLKHPLLQRYFEQGDWQEASTKYCTMEFVEGTNLIELKTELKKQGHKISSTDKLNILIKILHALHAAHSSGISHRNLRPHNLIVTAKGRVSQVTQWEVKLCDLALLTPTVESIDLLEPERKIFSAPELAKDKTSTFFKSDIYSVGVLFYFMLTQTFPDHKRVPASSIVPNLNKKIDLILDLCMAQEPDGRYESIKALLFDIEDLPADAFGEGPSTKQSQFTLVWVFLSLLVVASGVVYLMSQGSENKTYTTPQEQWASMRKKVLTDLTNKVDSSEEVAAKMNKYPQMVYIPKGKFIKGRLPNEPNTGKDDPSAYIVPMAGFYIDIYEYPNKKGEKALLGADWETARASCNKEGKRLCTEEEWERACKGSNFLIYSYGDDYSQTKCALPNNKSDYKIGLSPDCKNDFGVFDMSGGVPEWTYAGLVDQPSRRLVKGGKLGIAPETGNRCASQRDESMLLKDSDIGFRCCKEAE